MLCATNHARLQGLLPKPPPMCCTLQLQLVFPAQQLMHTHLDWLTCPRAGWGPPEAAVGSLTAVTHVIIERTSLSGSLPPHLGNLTDLATLALEFNRISGHSRPATTVPIPSLPLPYSHMLGMTAQSTVDAMPWIATS